MTTDERTTAGPATCRVLHRLARGRVHRHFRAGKRRLIELLLQHSNHNRAGLESDLQALIGERHSRSEPGSSRIDHPPAIAHKKASPRRGEPDSVEATISLSAWLEGLGVPSPQPFVPDPWQSEALSALNETDVVISVPTGSGKTYVAVEAARRAMEDNRSVIYITAGPCPTRNIRSFRIFGLIRSAFLPEIARRRQRRCSS